MARRSRGSRGRRTSGRGAHGASRRGVCKASPVVSVVFHEAAQAEYDDAVVYYQAISQRLGGEFQNETERAVQRIVALPHARRELGSGFRRCLLKRFPYGIVYRVLDGTIKIYAVMQLKRRPGYWRKRVEKAKQG